MSKRSDRILFRIMVIVVLGAGLFFATRSYLDPASETVPLEVAGIGESATPAPLTAGSTGSDGAVATENTALRVSWPPDGTEVPDSRPLLSGTASPLARIRVADRATIADEDGNWSATASVEPGPNAITVSDETTGNKVELTLLYDPDAGESDDGEDLEIAETPPTTSRPVVDPGGSETITVEIATTTTSTEQITTTARPTTTTTARPTTTTARPTTTTAEPTTTTTTTAPAPTTTKPTTTASVRPATTTTTVKPTTTTAKPKPTTTTTAKPKPTTTTTAKPKPTTTTTVKPTTTTAKPTTTTVRPTTTVAPTTTEVRECSRLNPDACRD